MNLKTMTAISFCLFVMIATPGCPTPTPQTELEIEKYEKFFSDLGDTLASYQKAEQTQAILDKMDELKSDLQKLLSHPRIISKESLKAMIERKQETFSDLEKKIQNELNRLKTLPFASAVYDKVNQILSESNF